MAAADSRSTVRTLESDSALADYAVKLHKELKLNNITVYSGCMHQQLEQMLAERDTVQRLPLSDFLTHMEQHFTHEQNPSALIVKDVLFALYTNPTAEERCRLNKLGHVPPPPPFGGITVQGPLNDIHGNEHVKAGL